MSKTLAPSVTGRDPKGLKFLSIVEAAFNKAQLSEEEAQRVNDTSGLSELVAGFITENRLPSQFVNEEVRSSYGYPKKHKIKSLAQQIEELRKHFPELSLEATQEFIDKALPTLKLPQGAEGWFAIPRWGKVAQTYNKAVERMIRAIASTRKFYNYREGELGPDRLRQHARSIEMWQKLGEQQKGDILIIPGQFGIRHRGRSVRRARVVFQADEFGFGAFAAGCMLLTHPERLERWEDLFIDCAGDEYNHPDDDGRFDRAPYFGFRDGEVEFRTHWVSDAHGDYGASSGFAPQ